MPHVPVTDDPDAIARYERADVIFVAQDGYRLAPARVRCYSFARLLNGHGLRAEVLSAFDHLAARLQGSAAAGMDVGEKMAVVQRAYGILRRNPAAVFYIQKVGYHALAALMAAAENGNRLVLDYDDYEVDLPSFAGLDQFLPSLRTADLLDTLARHSAACVASSHALYTLLHQRNPATHLIHTVADQEVFHTGRRDQPRRRFGDAVNVLWCGDVWGNLVMRDVLLAADCFAMLPEAVRRRARLHIIGFGAAWAELKARLRTRHPALDAAIALHEHIPPDAFGEVLAEMDVGLLPYHDNAFNAAKSPTKMFEYMLAGLAICATPVGEVTHCLEDGRTVLFGAGRAGFSAALGRLIADDALRVALGEAGAALGFARYSLQSAGPRLVDILRGIFAEPRPEPGTSRALPDAAIAAAMGRRRPVPLREAELALREAAALAAAAEPAAVPARSIAAPVLALLEWPGIAAHLGISEERRRELVVAVRPLRPSATLCPRAGAMATGRAPSASPPALCKLAAAEDWEDPDWFALARRYKVGWATAVPVNEADDPRSDAYDTAYNWFKRSRGVWERTQFLYALHRLGALSPDARALVASTDPDGIYLFLSREVAHVDVVDVGPGHAEAARLVAAGALDPWMSLPRLFDPARLHIHHWGEALRPLDGRVEVVLLPQNTAFTGGPARFAALMAWASDQLAEGGVLAFSSEVVLNPPAPVPWPTLAAAAGPPGGLCDLLVRHTGLVPQSTFDAGLSDATLDRIAVTGTPSADHPHFLRDTAGTLHVTGVWACRKAAQTPAGAWVECAAALFP